MAALIEFISKLGVLILDMIGVAMGKSRENEKKFEEEKKKTEGDAPQAAEDQRNTEKLRSRDPWQKDTSSRN